MDKRSLKSILADNGVYIEMELGDELPFPYKDQVAEDIKLALSREKSLRVQLPPNFSIVIPAGGYNYEAEEDVNTDYFEGNKSVHGWRMWGGFEVFADVNTETAIGEFVVTGVYDLHDDTVIGSTLTITKLEKYEG